MVLFTIERLRKLSEHPKSKNMHEGKFHNEDFEEYLNEYYFTNNKKTNIGGEIFENLNPNKFNLATDSFDIGWKIHLNVSPKDAFQVAKYLAKNGYSHKFLSGGKPQDGKVFTIYLGSFDCMLREVQILEKDLQKVLLKPIDHREIEVGKGIVARFTVYNNSFYKYGLCGMNISGEVKIPYTKLIRGDTLKRIMRNEELNDEEREILYECVRTTYDRLVQIFGYYFIK